MSHNFTVMVASQDLMMNLFVQRYPNPSHVLRFQYQVIIELIVRGPLQGIDVSCFHTDLVKDLAIGECIDVFHSLYLTGLIIEECE